MKPYRNERNLAQHIEIVQNMHGPKALPCYVAPEFSRALLKVTRAILAEARQRNFERRVYAAQGMM